MYRIRPGGHHRGVGQQDPELARIKDFIKDKLVAEGVYRIEFDIEADSDLERTSQNYADILCSRRHGPRALDADGVQKTLDCIVGVMRLAYPPRGADHLVEFTQGGVEVDGDSHQLERDFLNTVGVELARVVRDAREIKDIQLGIVLGVIKSNAGATITEIGRLREPAVRQMDRVAGGSAVEEQALEGLQREILAKSLDTLPDIVRERLNPRPRQPR